MNKKFTAILATSMLATTLVGCANNTAKNTTDDKAKSSKVESKKESKSTKKVETKKSTENASQKKMLDSIIEGANTQIPAMKEQLASTFSDIQITSENDNTIVYRYTFKDQQPTTVDLPALKPAMAKQSKPVFDATKAFIKDLHVKFIFEQPDKSELGSLEISQADIDALPAE